MMQPRPELQTAVPAPLLSYNDFQTAQRKTRLKQKRDRLKVALMFEDKARDVMNTLAIIGEQAWLADCKASMFSAALCIGRITPIHLPTVLRDRIIHEMLLGAIREALIDDGESWHMRLYRFKVIAESRAIARGKNLEGDAFDKFVAEEVGAVFDWLSTGSWDKSS